MNLRTVRRARSIRSASAKSRGGGRHRGLLILLVILSLASVKIWFLGSLFGKTVSRAPQIFRPNLADAQTTETGSKKEVSPANDPSKKVKTQNSGKTEATKKEVSKSAKTGDNGKNEREKKAVPKASSKSSETDLALIQALREKEEKLRQRESRLKQQEARLERLRREIERKVKELRAIQEKVASFVQEGKKISEERLKRLAKVYESAPPEKAGLLLSELDPSLAALILLRIDGRKAGRIWGFVVEDKAVRISQELTKLR